MTKPAESPELPVFVPFAFPDLRHLSNDDRAVEAFNETIEMCIFEIQKLNKRLDELQLVSLFFFCILLLLKQNRTKLRTTTLFFSFFSLQDIDRLTRDLQGCRLRSRTYSAMITKGGAEIPEYTAFLQQNQRPT